MRRTKKTSTPAAWVTQKAMASRDQNGRFGEGVVGGMASPAAMMMRDIIAPVNDQGKPDRWLSMQDAPSDPLGDVLCSELLPHVPGPAVCASPGEPGLAWVAIGGYAWAVVWSNPLTVVQ